MRQLNVSKRLVVLLAWLCFVYVILVLTDALGPCRPHHLIAQWRLRRIPGVTILSESDDSEEWLETDINVTLRAHGHVMAFIAIGNESFSHAPHLILTEMDRAPIRCFKGSRKVRGIDIVSAHQPLTRGLGIESVETAVARAEDIRRRLNTLGAEPDPEVLRRGGESCTYVPPVVSGQ